jgi:hypothetical protein
MESIHNTDRTFDFDKLNLAKPQQIPGGSFFIRLSHADKPLYIQPPKCNTKNGFLKANKKYYTDLMFTNENISFIEWMENLENKCQQLIYNNRNDWFESEMEMHDIENYFTSPLKIFKSGKYYLARVNIPTNLGKPSLKIYNEDEELVPMDFVKENMNIMSIIEIKGIKCSATCFQIALDLKQMMVMKPNNLFEACLFKKDMPAPIEQSKKISIPIKTNLENEEGESIEITTSINENLLSNIETEEVIIEDVDNSDDELEENHIMSNDTTELDLDKFEVNTHKDNVDTSVIDTDLEQIKNGMSETKDELQEINLTLDKITDETPVSIKNKNNVYYEMYKEAKRKAKMARNLALSSYLEAKRIKNVYMLDETTDSDDSDFENINEE